MLPLLAHHLELHHAPVLAAIYAVGFWCGWQNIARFLKR